MGQYQVSQEFSVQKEKISEYEKNQKKQKILRNEFETVGIYDIPLVKKQNIDIDKIELWGYSKTKANDEENRRKTIHFFTYDWLYDSVYSKPETALEKMDQYYALLTPDFSCYFNMPRALQINSTFKNRWCGAFWQSQGKIVIPTIGWGDEQTFDFCFDGVEKGSVVAVSTYSREGFEKEFLTGYKEMLRRINPAAIICYGELFDGMEGNIKLVSPYNHEQLISKLGLNEYAKRYLEGDLYPSN